MREVLIIWRREFLERVRTRSFLIGTIAFPLFIIALYSLPLIIGGGKEVTRLAVVDEGPAGVAEQLAASLRARTADRDNGTYEVEVVRQPLAEARAGLSERIANKELDGYVYVPADAVSAGRVEYRARNVANLETVGDVRRAASQAVQAVRLSDAGLEMGRVVALLRPVEVSTARITARGEEGGSALGTFFVAYGAALVMFLVIFSYGVNVMRSVLEEKTNRIVEVLVSSVPAGQMMMGKITGVASVALLQVAIWAVLGGGGTTLAGRLAAAESGQGAQGMESVMAALRLKPGSAVALLGFFVLGFLLFSALFAAIGAAVNTEQEAQQFQTFAMLPLVVPMMFLMKIVGDPLGQTATVLGLIPFTAPVTNAIRLGTAEIPAAQVAGSLALMAATTVFVAWAAGKIYRVGILSTGKKPSVAELVKWLRMA